MLSGLFDSVSSVVSGFTDVLSSAFETVSGLFYSYSAANGTFELTFLGTIAVIAVGAGLIWLIYRLIKGAIRGIGR